MYILIAAAFYQHEVCIQGERGGYGSCPARARTIPAPIAQPCLHPAAASRRKSGRLCRHRTKNTGRQPYRSPEPRGRYARTSEPP